MSSSIRYWIGFTVTVLLGAMSGHLLTYIMEPSTIRLLTTFILGGIIGIVGYRLTEIWSNEAEDKV